MPLSGVKVTSFAEPECTEVSGRAQSPHSPSAKPFSTLSDVSALKNRPGVLVDPGSPLPSQTIQIHKIWAGIRGL